MWLCIVFILFLSGKNRAENLDADSPLYQTEMMLQQEMKQGRITVSGTVAECNAVSEGIRLSINHITIENQKKSDLSLLPYLKIMITTEYENIVPGDKIRAAGEIAAFEAATNPGQFDSRAYYFAGNTVCSLKNAEVLGVESGKWSLTGVLYRIRRAFRRSYTRILEQKAARTIAAVSLGEKSWMESEWKLAYQEGGISHILAVSGLHITLIGMSLYRILRRAGISYAACAVVSGTAVLFYAVMTGFGVSAARAAFMFLIWLGAQISGRKYDMINAAAAAAVLLLVWNAENLLQSSFLLSFGAILSIAVLVPGVIKTCEIKTAAGKSSVSCIAVWLGTLPVSLTFFYQTSPWSILVNLAVIPLMSVVMSSGLAACAVGMVSVSAGMFLAAPVYYLLGCFEWLCQLEQKLPLSVWVAGKPAVWQVVLYYGILVLALFVFGRKVSAKIWKKHFVRFLWLICGLICLGLMGCQERQGMEIVCLDVGQGDGALVRLPSGENCLIDGGSTSKKNLWKYTIEPAVKYYGMRTLDYVFLSHADKDHLSGIEEFLQEYEPGFRGQNVHGITLRYLVLPVTSDSSDFLELKKLAGQKGIKILSIKEGDRIGSMDWVIRCAAPDPARLSGDRNEDSMVLMLQYDKFRMLFTGDLEGDAEKKLAGSGVSLRADVLKVGHHGSAGGSSELFLKQVRPLAAVISCGADNPYGHPSREVLWRLQDSGCRIMQTQNQGAVFVCSDGETFSVKTYAELP